KAILRSERSELRSCWVISHVPSCWTYFGHFCRPMRHFVHGCQRLKSPAAIVLSVRRYFWLSQMILFISLASIDSRWLHKAEEHSEAAWFMYLTPSESFPLKMETMVCRAFLLIKSCSSKFSITLTSAGKAGLPIKYKALTAGNLESASVLIPVRRSPRET